MKKLNWFLLAMLFALMPVLQSCDDDDDDDNYYSWDWATVHTTGGGGYYLEGDGWGSIMPASTTIPWYNPVDGQRIVAYFDPLKDNQSKYDVAVRMKGVREVLTKKVEELTAENDKEFGNDPIVIYEGDMWLGGKYLNLVFQQSVPRLERHRISLVREAVTPLIEDGYVHLVLRYNTYGDQSNYWKLTPVSYNLSEFYPEETKADAGFKGFKVVINSKTNGERTLTLDLDHPVAVPESSKNVHESSLMIK